MKACLRWFVLFVLAANASAQTGVFVQSDALIEPRLAHTATLLNDGRVLIAGGGVGPDLIDGWGVVPDAVIFDPRTGRFVPAGTSYHDIHTATLLQSGQVLLAGGESGYAGYSPIVTTAADLYDPIKGVFQPTGSMVWGRESHTATLLRDGRVLITGGLRPQGFGWATLSSAEIYDPATGTFSSIGDMRESRTSHTATLLNDGRVLIIGGSLARSAEIFDPVTGSFAATGNTVYPRIYHTATLLLNGQVLVAGGNNSVAAEIFDPATGSFREVGAMSYMRISATATRLQNGKVLIAGGAQAFIATTFSAELFDPATGSFTATANMSNGRFMHTATLLSDGSVLIAGGADLSSLFLNFVSGAEIYKPDANSGTISATPNPCVLAGSVCTSYLNWNTTGISNAQVWAKIDDGPEAPFAALPSCASTACPAPWIQGGGLTYTFTLYDCDGATCTIDGHDGARAIASVQVTAREPSSN
jgi:hypothetical protein